MSTLEQMGDFVYGDAALTKLEYDRQQALTLPIPPPLRGTETPATSNNEVSVNDCHWTVSAMCKGIRGIFYPPSHFERKDDRIEREARAKEICGTCAVRQACLEEALATKERHGVWGGLTEDERKRLLGIKSRRKN